MIEKTGLPVPGRWFAAVAAFVVVFLGLFTWSGSLPLDNDVLYADVARTMLRSGDWLNPNIHGVPFLDKPPLQFWLIAASEALWGDTTFGLRFPTVMTGVATAILVFWAAARMPGSERTRLVSGVVAVMALLGTPLWFEYARRVYMEVPVGLFSFAATLAFGAAHELLNEPGGSVRQDGKQRSALGAFALAGLFLGLGFMAKSLVGLFPAIGFSVWILLETRGRALLSRELWVGAAVTVVVLLLVAGPWHVQQLLTQRDIFLEFTWKLHVEQQVLSAQPWSTGPAWFYLAVLARDAPLFGLVLLCGWGLLLVRVLRKESTYALDRLVAVTGLVMFVVLSASATKKDLYLVPLVPVAALLFGRQVASLESVILRRSLAAAAALGLLLDVPLLDPSGPILQGASVLVPSATAARDHSTPDETLHTVNLYFVASQYYAERRAVSVFTETGPAAMTGHIPYIKHGHNMRDVPTPELPRVMREERGLWLMPSGVMDELQRVPGLGLEVLYRESGLVLARPKAS
jgi:4-amino-4-deoxy-L-arabinose transferase-like glycosyltransferase